MIRKQYLKGLAIIAMLLITAQTTTAQKDTTLRREVEVVKAYSPTAIDAEKINDMPVIKEEVHKKPLFNYGIISQPVFSTLSVTNLQAANIVGQPKEKPGFGLLRLGAGNYNKPYGELFFNNRGIKNSIFGLHMKHLSSHSKLTLEGGDRVKAPFSDNTAEMFLKHMFRKSTLSMNLGVDHNGFNYYGYPADSIPSFLKTGNPILSHQGERQTFTKGGININLQNISASKSDPSTGFDFKYHYFGNKTGQREQFGSFKIDVNKPYNFLTLLIVTGAEYSTVSKVFNDKTMLNDTRSQTWLFLKPALLFGNETINLRAGFNTWMTFGNLDKTTYKITPNVRFNFAPVKEIINVFAGIDGNYHHNYYSAVAYANPFIDPALSLKNHFEKFRYYGGFDGKFSSATNFKIQVDYSVIEAQPLYFMQGFRMPTVGITPGKPYVYNTFNVLYDDMNQLKFNAEITHNLGEKFNMLVSASYYKYTLTEQTKAWNLPQFDANLSLSYKVNDRLTVSTDLYAIGKREGLIIQLNNTGNRYLTYDQISLISARTETNHVMDMAIDLNVRGSYDITRKLSAFAQLNNFGFRKYERWMGYPVQSFNALAGISLSF